MRTALGTFLIGAGSVLISLGEAIAKRRWLHPAEQPNSVIDDRFPV